MAVTKLLVFQLNPVAGFRKGSRAPVIIVPCNHTNISMLLTFETNHENQQGNILSGIISSYSLKY